MRSLEGSLVVGAVAFLCSFVSIMVSGQLGIDTAALVSVYVAVTAAALEAVSTHGLDNVFVPLGTMVAFGAVRHDSVSALLIQLSVMAIVAAFIVAIVSGRSSFAGGPVLVAVLMFIILKVGGYTWVLPFLMMIVIFVIYDRLAPESRSQQIRRTSMDTVVAGLGAPCLLLVPWTFAQSDLLRTGYHLAFVAALASTAGVMWFALPQLPTFRFRHQLGRLVHLDPVWHYRSSIGSLSFSFFGLAMVVASGLPGHTAWRLVIIAILAGLLGTMLFVWVAATFSARMTCPKCGSTVISGLGCCTLPTGDVRGFASLNFSNTLALANIVAMLTVAIMYIAEWSLT